MKLVASHGSWLRISLGLYTEGDVPETDGELVTAAVLSRDCTGEQRSSCPADHHCLQRRGQSDPGPPRGETSLSARLHRLSANDHGLSRPCQEHVCAH